MRGINKRNPPNHSDTGHVSLSDDLFPYLPDIEGASSEVPSNRRSRVTVVIEEDDVERLPAPQPCPRAVRLAVAINSDSYEIMANSKTNLWV